jgi:hypothetical protein
VNPRCDYCGWRIDRGANNKRIAELEAELASIYAALYDGRSVTLADGFAAEEVQRLKRELADARRDSARLDTMATIGDFEQIVFNVGGEYWEYHMTLPEVADPFEGRGATPEEAYRACIDAAREEKPAEEEPKCSG